MAARSKLPHAKDRPVDTPTDALADVYAYLLRRRRERQESPPVLPANESYRRSSPDRTRHDQPA